MKRERNYVQNNGDVEKQVHERKQAAGGGSRTSRT